MTREEHNAHWQAARKPTDIVYCNTLGYGELSQYDSRCGACWLRAAHTWERHDTYLRAYETREESRQT